MNQKIFSITQGVQESHKFRLPVFCSASLLAMLATILVLVVPTDNSAVAQRSHTYFTPEVNITIPQTDANEDGVNDWVGTRFDVMFTHRMGGYTPCTAVETIPHQVFPDGSVKRMITRDVLIDVPRTRSNKCLYAVSWPSIDGLALKVATSEMSSDTQTAMAVYELSDDRATTFTPVVNITVPQWDENGDGVSDYTGIKFNVRFQQILVYSYSSHVQQILKDKFGDKSRYGNALSYNPACPRRFYRNYVVLESGAVAGSAPVLVDRPAGLDINCQYSVTIELERSHLSPIIWSSRQGNGLVDASAPTYGEVYIDVTSVPTEYTPYMNILVPQVDADGNDVNDYAGTSFVVVFENSWIQPQPGCTKFASGTYVVQDSGIVTGSGPSLVRYKLGMTREETIRNFYTRRCRYNRSYPRVPGLVLKSNALSYSGGAELTYEATDAVQFPPEVEITVPQFDADENGVNDFAGKNFYVRFRRAPASDVGCTPLGAGLYTVQDSGSVSGVAPYLVHSPTGVTAECVYNIEWPDVSGLARQSGATTSVRASAKSATASYRSTTTPSFASSVSSFAPNVGIIVPKLDADGNGVNDFSGTSFVVTFRRVFGSDSGCTASAVGTYFVRNDGLVAGSAPSLVDRPAGVTSDCSYAVAWPTLTGLVRQLGATATVSASSKSVSATYLTGPTYVAPAPEVAEPTVEEPEVEEVEEPAPEIVEPVDDVAEETEEEPVVEETQSPGNSAGGGATVTGGGNTGAGVDSSGDVSEAAPGAPVPEVGVIQLSQGWVMLPFNGPSGMTPADFAQALENAINSVWVWDMSAQRWKGWTSSRGSLGLASLVPGDVVMVYAPTGGVVVYSPADLLGHRVGVNSWTLAPTGISLVVYGGGTATSASDVFASYANSAVVVYLWDSQNQRWEYHLPGRQPLSAVQVPWFSDINPGDAMFVYNISPTAVTIPWQ